MIAAGLWLIACAIGIAAADPIDKLLNPPPTPPNRRPRP